MWKKNVLIFVCVVALVEVVLAAKTKECNKLLNCQTCLDDSHCESCPDGYYLDSKRVCRYNCTEKFGRRCPQCTADKCICPSNQKWDSTAKKCLDVPDCSDSDPEACAYCGVGFDLIDLSGKCSTCAAVFGAGCASCSDSKCLNATEGYKLCGAVAVNATEDCPAACGTLIPGCSDCSENGTCAKCADNAELVDGFCKYKLPTCEAGKKVILVKDSFTCGNCQSFDENCVGNRCSGRGCSMCKTGYAVTAAGGCMNCTSTYTGCAMCQEDACTKCRLSTWILTPNGCFNQNPYVPPSESNGGLIAGIVIAALVLVAIVIVAIFCIVVNVSKHGQIDPSVYEDDLQFKSVSVL